MQVNILLIDDDKDYCEVLAGEALHYGFELKYSHNLEEGFELLVGKKRIKALILDGRCPLSEREIEPPRSNFVTKAITLIHDIETDHNRIIPFCINTEHPEDFSEGLDGIAPVFTKNTEHQNLFKWLRQEINLLPDTIIRNQFSDIFEKTEGRFLFEEEDLLIDILQTRHSFEQAQIISNLAMLRRLLERLMDICCIDLLGTDPVTLPKNRGGRAGQIIELMRNKFLPDELYHIAKRLYKSCSSYGSHRQIERLGQLKYTPGRYSMERLCFSYLELADYLLSQNKK